MLPDLGFRCPFALPSIALILEPSRGVVLLDVAARASGSPGSLPVILLGWPMLDRDRAEAGLSPILFWQTAELFTTTRFALLRDKPASLGP